MVQKVGVKTVGVTGFRKQLLGFFKIILEDLDIGFVSKKSRIEKIIRFGSQVTVGRRIEVILVDGVMESLADANVVERLAATVYGKESDVKLGLNVDDDFLLRHLASFLSDSRGSRL